MTTPTYQMLEAGPFSKLDGAARVGGGKLFLKEGLGLTGMEVSLNRLPAGASVPFHHSHRENEELYVFLSGQGQFQIDGQIIEVSEGTSIRVAPAGVRTLRCHGGEDLHFIVVQARDGSLRQYTRTDGVLSDQPVTWPE
ncbi:MULTISPECIES: cupin domain-containing protein [Paenibacillus]|uniref:cupin domain-containing protein n=1 Tax=Paenibacillus TaxID=44249 RepID=UPI0022B8E688|nr:cupin domain-containing protein [Paenibacillus caseinilyticus]MCZ8523210.1 cupin domain-containing protein [Paenibacillus caseinilyticus]